MKYYVLNEQGKFGAEIFSNYTDIMIFVLWYSLFWLIVYKCN